jgi:2-polyprenyl-3-methyl-5-hydroxy-6-metoxy-1,4-benzoquinol methylase
MTHNNLHGDHHHYDHYSTEMMKRLNQFYGRVDGRMNDRIMRWVSGESVLDVGCGFGPLTEFLRMKGFKVIGVDLLESCVNEGRKCYPEADLRVAESEELDFPDKSFDTIILKDVIHHVYEEDDVVAFLADIRRVTRCRIIILDPNPMFILLCARKLIGHVDPVCHPKDAVRIVTEAGFNVVHLDYSELFAFPMSGGYVGPVFVPAQPRWIGTVILALDNALMSIARAMGLGRFVGWRYMLVADLPN